jgi:hypothetical protein
MNTLKWVGRFVPSIVKPYAWFTVGSGSAAAATHRWQIQDTQPHISSKEAMSTFPANRWVTGWVQRAKHRPIMTSTTVAWKRTWRLGFWRLGTRGGRSTAPSPTYIYCDGADGRPLHQLGLENRELAVGHGYDRRVVASVKGVPPHRGSHGQGRLTSGTKWSGRAVVLNHGPAR